MTAPWGSVKRTEFIASDDRGPDSVECSPTSHFPHHVCLLDYTSMGPLGFVCGCDCHDIECEECDGANGEHRADCSLAAALADPESEEPVTQDQTTTPCPEPDCRTAMERTVGSGGVRFHCPTCQMSWSEAEVIVLAAADEAPCSMATEKPYDFAWCETHDETFPLGGICPLHPKAPKDGAL